VAAQIGYYDTLKSVAGKVFTYLASITLTGTDGKTLTVTQDTSLDEAVAMSSKAPKASPMFTTPSLGVATATSINSGYSGAGSLAGLANTTKTITIDPSDASGYLEIGFGFYGNAGTGTGVLKFSAGGYFGVNTYYSVVESARANSGNVVIGASVTKGSGSMSFTIQSTDPDTVFSFYFYNSTVALTVSIN